MASGQKVKDSLWSLPSKGQLGFLAIAVYFTPARLWAVNRVEIGFPDGLLIWSGLMLVLGLLLWTALVRLGTEPEGTTYSLFWFLVGLGALGSLQWNVPGGSWTVFVGLLAATFVIYRLKELKLFAYLTQTVALYAFILPIGIVVSSTVGLGESQQLPPEEIVVSEFRRTPDVVLLVFDGHGSFETLDRYFGDDSDARVGAYESEGLSVSSGMKANYSLTQFSLASFLEMDYPMTAGMRAGDAEWASLLNTVRGDNQLVDLFKSQGYRFVVVESGWAGVQCTGYTDLCIKGTWPDNATSDAIRQSLFGEIRSIQSAFTTGSVHTIEWLSQNIAELSSNGVADLIFAHVMAPHPPLYLDAACEYRWMPNMEGTALAWPWIPQQILDERAGAYIEQVECAQKALFEIASQAGSETLILAFADHGPDSQGQLFKAPEEWTTEDIDERFPVLFVSNDDSCEFSDLESLVNVGRRLVFCLSGEPVDLLEDRYFVTVGAKVAIDADSEPILEIETFPEPESG